MPVIPDANKRRIIEQAGRLLAQPGATQRSVAADLGVGQSTLCEWLRADGIKINGNPESGPEPAGVSDMGDHVIVTSDVRAHEEPEEKDKAEALLEKRGYHVDKYVVDKIVTSEWGNPDEPLFQDKVWARRKDLVLTLPGYEDFKPFEFGQIEEYAEHRVAFIPDMHAPFVNWRAFGAVLDFLRNEEPERVVILGDAGDHTNLSKHRTHPRFAATLNETNQRIADNFRLIREACPIAKIDFIPGNHDDRILYYSREVGGELAGFKNPKVWPGEPDPVESLSYRNIYGLDKLGITLVNEDWQLAALEITPELTAQHGYLTGPNSEKKMLEKEGRSQVHGHTHHGSVVYRTRHNPLDIRVVMDCGTLSQVAPDGLGYAPKPDWTPGMGWANVWEDGLFSVNFIPFVKDKLLTPWGAAFDGKEVE